VSRLIGLPGYEEHVGAWLGDSTEDYLGIPSLLVEAAFVVLFVVVISLQARARALAQESSSSSSQRRQKVGTVLLIGGAVAVLAGHVLHLLFFSGP
jgi:uncharacterized membrane protein